jgi:xylulose-5-phosphate/fructose-6-phosphate phosphoketolase
MSKDSLKGDSADAIEAFWQAANYISVCLLYLRSNPMLRRPLTLSDIKPRVVGHWGCVPSLNFIWANLLSVISATGIDVRLFFGTGHAGAVWLACTYLEGSLSHYYVLKDDEASLAELSAAFGRMDGYPTELSVQYPGVLWPSGELGYTLGIAHGHALSVRDGTVVAVLGDGELETAPTSAALHGIRKFLNRPSRLTIIVNLNGLRMGGPSEISRWTDREIRDYFAGLGLNPHFVEGFDIYALSAALKTAIFASQAPGPPYLILLRTPKGATMPRFPNGEDLTGTIRSHKVPIKKVRELAEIAWLEAWLRSYQPERIFNNGRLDRFNFASILPSNELLIGSVRDRLRSTTQTSIEYKRDENNPTPSTTAVEAFVETVGRVAENSSIGVLLTSPDELSSNRLDALRSSKVEIVEYLSEHQCLSWSIGAITGGRPSWYTSYDAFAPIISSIVTQYLKFLESAVEARISILDQPLNIFLTSLGWRNVYSHQDPGFTSSLMEKHFSSFRCFLPASPASMIATVEICHCTPNRVNCIIADKYPNSWTTPKFGLPNGDPFTLVRQWGAGKSTSFKITFLATGDYLVREAAFAAEAIARVAKHVTTQTVVLEELTWLYRTGTECDAQRMRFQHLVAESNFFLLVTSLYDDVVSALVHRVLPPSSNITSHGYRSSSASVTPLSVLIESKSSWIQLTAEALNHLIRYNAKNVAPKTFSSVLNELESIEIKIRQALVKAYDDPEWYWRLKPEDLFI